MRALVIVLALVGGLFLVLYAFRFSPDKLYLLICLVASLASWRAIYRYLLRHWKAHPDRVQAAKLNAANVFFQATGVVGGIFFVLCFVIGMLVTNMLGSSTVERGTVVSSRWSRGCAKLTVKTDNAGFVRLCTQTPYGTGSAIAVKVRKSSVGHYVE
jgi:hypothetical protein